MRGRLLGVGVDLGRALEEGSAAFAARSVETATQARDALRSASPDAVVLAGELPETAGVAFCEELAREPPSVPVVFHPASGSESLASDALAAGAVDYVPQSADPERLVAGIERAIAGDETARRGDADRGGDLRSFRRAVESSGHAILITDVDGTIEYVNPAFEELTGYSRDEILGQTPSVLQSGEHGEDFYRELWETILDGDVWQGNVINERADGDRIVVDQTIAPIVDATGEIARFVGINRDVTERAESEQRVENQRDGLDVLNQMVRHDIRNDLQVVSTYLDILDDHVDEDGQQYLAQARESTQNAIDLTKTARDLAEAMLQSERDHEPTPIRKTVQSQVDVVQASHDHASITVDGSIPAVDVQANEMLDSVVWNLLTNAVEHNDGDEPEVTVSATTHDDHFQLRVADDGPGVLEAQKSEIFGKGEKGLESDGTGIGLYLVQRLVDDYGGRVWVEDRLTEATDGRTQAADGGSRRPVDGQSTADGAVFVVELPMA
jgi:PAS domain S-box-containing protein